MSEALAGRHWKPSVVMSKAKGQGKNRAKPNRPLDPLLADCLRRGRRGQMFKEIRRDRFLSGEELARFFEALDLSESETFRDFLLLALFTGARRSNVLSMRWKDTV